VTFEGRGWETAVPIQKLMMVPPKWPKKHLHRSPFGERRVGGGASGDALRASPPTAPKRPPKRDWHGIWAWGQKPARTGGPKIAPTRGRAQ
jgi:hypothetical protein